MGSTAQIEALLLGALSIAATACNGESELAPRDALTIGWTVQPDEPAETSPAMRFVRDADGIEAKPGPNACLWHPDLTATGNYRLVLDVTHLDSGLHPHGAGLTFGGRGVHGTDARYTYFLVRGDRHFLIKLRSGNDTVELVNWTEHDAVAGEDGQGVTKNLLSVEIRSDDVRFLVNGTEVHRSARADVPAEGQFGLRLVHDLHVRFGQPILQPLP